MEGKPARTGRARWGLAAGAACVQEAARTLNELEASASPSADRAGAGRPAQSRPKLALVKPALREEGGRMNENSGRGRKKPTGKTGGLTGLMAMVEGAEASGLMPAAAKPAALSLAGQIARLEARFEEYYRLGEQDEEARRSQSSPEALDRMTKCEKQLADLKARFFEMAGLDRQYAARAQLAELQCRAAETGGEVLVKLEGFGEVAMQEE